MIRRIGLVARREFVTTISRKGFIIGLLLMPVLISLMAVLGPRMMASRAAPVRGVVQVHDPTAAVLPDLRERLAPEAIAARRADERRRVLDEALPGGGAMTAVARRDVGPPVPELAVEALEATDLAGARAALAGSDSPLLAVVSIDPDAVRRAAGSTEYGSYQLYLAPRVDPASENLLHDGLRQALVRARLQAGGMDPALAEAALRVRRPAAVTLGDSSAPQRRGLNRILPFVMGVLLFIGIMSGAQTLMTSTIEEKSSRIVEVLLAAVSPLELMWGKLLGQLGVGLVVLALYVVLGLLMLFQFALFGLIDPSLIVWLFVFFLLSYLFFGSLMLSIGAAVNQPADAQSLMGPVMLLLVLPYVLTPMIGQSPNSPLATALSFIPPVNCFAMLARLASSSPPPLWQAALSVVVGLIAAGGVVWFAAKVFRVGLLMHGKPPSFATMVRWVRLA